MNFTIVTKDYIETVNARDIWTELESKQQFADWMKKRIEQSGFVEGEDYIKLHKKMKLSATGQTLTEYYVSTDMAKHLGMMERNAKGKEVRQYFIDVEKERRANMTPSMILVEQAQNLVIMERRQNKMSAELKLVETEHALLKARTDLIETQQKALSGQLEKLSIKAYCNLEGIRKTAKEMNRLGRAASQYSRDNGIPISKVTDPVYGEINAYDRDVLLEVVQ